MTTLYNTRIRFLKNQAVDELGTFALSFKIICRTHRFQNTIPISLPDCSVILGREVVRLTNKSRISGIMEHILYICSRVSWISLVGFSLLLLLRGLIVYTDQEKEHCLQVHTKLTYSIYCQILLISGFSWKTVGQQRTMGMSLSYDF